MSAATTATCQACSQDHYFYLPVGDRPVPGKQHSYICPHTGKRTSFQAPSQWHEVRGRPSQSGVVVVTSE